MFGSGRGPSVGPAGGRTEESRSDSRDTGRSQRQADDLKSKGPRAVDPTELDAVILAGGLGTRLRPILPQKQKVVAEIQGRPFLGYLLDWLWDEGVRRFVFCVGYRSEDVVRFVQAEERMSRAEVVFSQEAEPLRTGGALRLASRHFRSDPILVVNGDTFLAVPLAQFLAFHNDSAADATIAAVTVENPARFGVMTTDAKGRVVALSEKGRTEGRVPINGGFYVLQRDLAAAIPAGIQSLEKDILPGWIATRKVMAFAGDFPFVDIGVPESLAAARDVVRTHPKERR